MMTNFVCFTAYSAVKQPKNVQSAAEFLGSAR